MFLGDGMLKSDLRQRAEREGLDNCRFKLTGRRSLHDSSFDNISAFASSYYSLAWVQKWRTKINSTVELTYSNQDFNVFSNNFLNINIMLLDLFYI